MIIFSLRFDTQWWVSSSGSWLTQPSIRLHHRSTQPKFKTWEYTRMHAHEQVFWKNGNAIKHLRNQVLPQIFFVAIYHNSGLKAPHIGSKFIPFSKFNSFSLQVLTCTIRIYHNVFLPVTRWNWLVSACTYKKMQDKWLKLQYASLLSKLVKLYHYSTVYKYRKQNDVKYVQPKHQRRRDALDRQPWWLPA